MKQEDIRREYRHHVAVSALSGLDQAKPRTPRITIEWYDGPSGEDQALIIVATKACPAKVDGRAAYDVPRHQLWLDGDGRPIRYRFGGLTVVAIFPEDGMLVKWGQAHFVVIDSLTPGGSLAAIDSDAYGRLLKARLEKLAEAASATRSSPGLGVGSATQSGPQVSTTGVRHRLN